MFRSQEKSYHIINNNNAPPAIKKAATEGPGFLCVIYK